MDVVSTLVLFLFCAGLFWWAIHLNSEVGLAQNEVRNLARQLMDAGVRPNFHYESQRRQAARLYPELLKQTRARQSGLVDTSGKNGCRPHSHGADEQCPE